MANDTLNLKVVTPAGVALEDSAISVTLPSVDGEIGILPQHTQYTGLLGIGVLSYTAPDNSTKKIVVSGGFCQFSDGTLTVLADSIDTRETVDPKAAASRPDLQRIIDTEDTASPQWAQAKETLSRLEAIERL